MNEQTLKKILNRLNILVGLQLNPFYWEKATDREKIEKLKSFGLEAGEIAEILGKSSEKISKQLYALKKKGGKK